MNIVTGATGHLGANLVRRLLEQGEEVRVLVRRESRALEGLEIERVKGDIRDRESLKKAFKGADRVYHLAAMISIVGDPDGQVRAVNVGGSEAVARVALESGVSRLIYCSSIHAFNMRDHSHPIDENSARVNDTPGMANAYDRSKSAAELKVRAIVKEGLDAVIVHPTGVIGPWDFAPSRMGKIFLNLYRRSMPALIDGGFDFVDVRDVVHGMIAAADKGRTNESYILSGQYQAIAEVARIAGAVTGVGAPRFEVPMWIAKLAAPLMQSVAKVSNSEPLYTSESLEALRANPQIDHAKASRELGYHPRPIRESIFDLYEWFVREGFLPAETRLHR